MRLYLRSWPPSFWHGFTRQSLGLFRLLFPPARPYEMGSQPLDGCYFRNITKHGKNTMEGKLATQDNAEGRGLEICDWCCGIWRWLGCKWGLSWTCCLESPGTTDLGSLMVLWVLGWRVDLDGESSDCLKTNLDKCRNTIEDVAAHLVLYASLLISEAQCPFC